MSEGPGAQGAITQADGLEPEDHEGGARLWRRWGGLVVLAAVFAVLVGPMAWLEAGRTDIPAHREAGYPSEVIDQDHYHWSVILAMEGTWPIVEVVSYDSATTPGYHWVMAGMLLLTGSRAPLLAVNALVGFALTAALWWGVAGMIGGWRAVVLAAPVMASPYVLGGSIWLTTDNAALMLVTVVLVLAVLRRFTVGNAAWMSALESAAVLVRQIHVWPVAVIGLSGLLRSPLARFAPAALQDETRQSPRAWRYLVAAVVAASVPVAVLGVFVWLWGGLLPKSEWIRGFHGRGMNGATPALGLTLGGVYGLFFLGLAWEQVRRIRIYDWGLWAAGAAGLVVGAAMETSRKLQVREFGWVWRMVARVDAAMARATPGFASLERSPVIIVGAVVGAIVILILYRSAREAGNRTPALMLLLALGGWLCAQTANTMAWQRYFDPMVLIGLAMLGALCIGQDGKACPRWAWAGPLALAVGQLALAAVTMYRVYLGLVP